MNPHVHRLLSISICVPAILLCFNACRHDQAENGGKKLITESRPVVAPFDEVSLSSEFTVYIMPSAKDSISVEAHPDQLKEIITEIKGSRLEISTNHELKVEKNPVVINIFSRNAGQYGRESDPGSSQNNESSFGIINTGKGTIKADVHVSHFTAFLSGAGRMELWGKCSSSKMTLFGTGTIDSYGFIQESCQAEINGKGSMYVYVREFLDAKVSNCGSVLYKGSPDLKKQLSGNGRITGSQATGSLGYHPQGSANSFLSKSMFFIY